jgi:hypothetical protein
MIFGGVFERGREPDPLGLRLGQRGLELLQPRLVRGLGLLHVEDAPRNLRGIVERLVEQRLHCAALLFGQGRLLRSGGRVVFELRRAPVGKRDAFKHALIIVAGELEIGRLLLDQALKVGDLGAPRREFGRLLRLGQFERVEALLRDREHFAQPDAFGVEGSRLLLRGGQVLAQLAVSDARAVECTLEAELLVLPPRRRAASC